MEMGIGDLGAPGVILKRKFRYTFEIFTDTCGNVPKSYVKVAARPKLDIDELEVSFLNAVTWFPGKAKWQPITVTYIDVPDQKMQPLYDWVATIYDFQNNTALHQAEKRDWNAYAMLTLYDGCGSEIETWQLMDLWPQSVDFGELDYSSNDEVTITLTLRYSKVYQEGKCGPSASGHCTGCDG